jgi:hypothetical protein
VIDVYVTGLIGTVQQLETANAGGGSGGGSSISTQGTSPNPTGVAISNSSNPSSNFGMTADEISSASGTTGGDSFNVGFSDFSNGQADINILINDLSDYSGVSSSADIGFLGYIQATNATSFQWGLSVSSSLSAGSASTSGTPSTSQDATTSSALSTGINTIGRISWGGGRGGFIFPSNGDTVTFTISASATNSNGTTNATSLVVEYTFQS